MITVLVCFEWTPAPAQDRFIKNNDGTVTDSNSGLMWAQTDNQADIYWKDARDWIKSRLPDSVNPQYNNWRLPTVEELEQLYLENPNYPGYRTSCGHSVKMVPQIQISCILVWSSDSALGLPVAFNFNLGSPFTVDVHDRAGCRVLAVRNVE
jgi:hypothetical protein